MTISSWRHPATREEAANLAASAVTKMRPGDRMMCGVNAAGEWDPSWPSWPLSPDGDRRYWFPELVSDNAPYSVMQDKRLPYQPDPDWRLVSNR